MKIDFGLIWLSDYLVNFIYVYHQNNFWNYNAAETDHNHKECMLFPAIEHAEKTVLQLVVSLVAAAASPEVEEAYYPFVWEGHPGVEEAYCP